MTEITQTVGSWWAHARKLWAKPGHCTSIWRPNLASVGATKPPCFLFSLFELFDVTHKVGDGLRPRT